MGKRKPFDLPETPAIITPDHVRDRVISPGAGAPRAWRKLSPLEAAYAKNHLAGGNPKYTAQQRFEAGQNYAQIFLIAQSSGRDSTQALNVSRSAFGAGSGTSQAMAELARTSLHRQLTRNDAAIVQAVCGEGLQPAEAMRLVFGDDYEKATLPRFREALDCLIDAFRATRAVTERVLQ